MSDKSDKQVTFTFKLPKSDLDLFRYVAEKTDRNMSQILRSAIKSYIKNEDLRQIDIDD